MSSMNRLANCRNMYQGQFKRVLCCCSAGLLRSPTTAVVLSQPPYNFNTRACGVNEDYALIVLDDVLLAWAQEVVVMNASQAEVVRSKGYEGKIIVLDIPDQFAYRNEQLIELIKTAYDKAAAA